MKKICMERSLDMATIEKIRNDIAKTKDKIAELQKIKSCAS